MKLNDVGSNNGIFEAWADGQLLSQDHQRVWRCDPAARIYILEMVFFYGGGRTSAWAAPDDQYIYFDNWIVSTRPLTH